ncbi:hypothetical protein [Rivularia sp. UHCC 0363]|uniref:hypothetical protein n=1 Tax=Rivularia sp. UHCC 0363 TaxID=3110244 RepID=UPI002B218B6F|nr:hypothetical protein [Rivularia sp. UHCC 0363]MEA5595718.1 hypothetical protein [Rivularia sp. UHCC 0363]
MTFYDGQTDSLQSQFHSSIKWSVQHNRIVGTCDDTPLFRQIVASATIDGKPQDAGRYEMHSAIANQVTKISWYSHLGEIHFQVIFVSEPS